MNAVHVNHPRTYNWKPGKVNLSCGYSNFTGGLILTGNCHVNLGPPSVFAEIKEGPELSIHQLIVHQVFGLLSFTLICIKI